MTDLEDRDFYINRAKATVSNLIKDMQDENMAILIRYYCADELNQLREAIKRAEKRQIPNLSRIVQFLSENPEMGTALERMVLHIDMERNQWPSPYSDQETFNKDAGILRSFVEAMSGGR